MKKITFILMLLIPFWGISQSGFQIQNGAHLVVNGSSSIMIYGNLTNEGSFEASNSTIIMAGQSPLGYSTVGGSSFTSFNNLQIAKTGNNVLLDANIEVSGQIQMVSGNLDLNGNDIQLTGSIEGETAARRITGTSGGEIIKMVDLNIPLGENPGNMGLNISSLQNFGQTYIIRGHTAMNINGSPSIFRYYEIIPTQNTNLEATVRFEYFDQELVLGTHIENDLQQWHGSGSNWTAFANTQSDLVANWIETNNVNDFAFITLSGNDSPPLPIELLTFDARVNHQNEVELTWVTATEINNDFFTVERSKDAVNFEDVIRVESAGNSASEQSYAALDRDPHSGISYYRLKQTDLDGSFTYSEIRAVRIDEASGFYVYPNPFTNKLDLLGHLSGKEEITIELINNIGQTLYSQKINTNETEIQHQIRNLDRLAAGNYVLVVKTGSSKEQFKLVKAE